jgi:hypothetical protein
LTSLYDAPFLILVCIGSGKSTLVTKLLTERIIKDKIPCYYWSLKDIGHEIDFGVRFFKLFGIEEAVGQDKIVKETVSANMLKSTLESLAEQNGAPCVLVIDDAQVMNDSRPHLIVFDRPFTTTHHVFV